MENGVEADNLSVIKNWRHSVGPGQLGPAQDDGVHPYILYTQTCMYMHTLYHTFRVCPPGLNRGLQSGRSSEGESLLNSRHSQLCKPVFSKANELLSYLL